MRFAATRMQPCAPLRRRKACSALARDRRGANAGVRRLRARAGAPVRACKRLIAPMPRSPSTWACPALLCATPGAAGHAYRCAPPGLAARACAHAPSLSSRSDNRTHTSIQGRSVRTEMALLPLPLVAPLREPPCIHPAQQRKRCAPAAPSPRGLLRSRRTPALRPAHPLASPQHGHAAGAQQQWIVPRQRAGMRKRQRRPIIWQKRPMSSSCAQVRGRGRFRQCWELHIYMHAYMHTYMHTYIHTYMHAYIHTCIHTYIHTYRHTCVCIYTYVHTYIHAYAYIWAVYTHTHIHTFVNQRAVC